MKTVTEHFTSIVVGMIAAGFMLAGSAIATDMPPLAEQYGCTHCHAIDKTVVGPAWVDVSRRYHGTSKYITKNGTEYPLKTYLAKKVSMGGNGNWGVVPMVANDPGGSRQAGIKELVEFILLLRQ